MQIKLFLLNQSRNFFVVVASQSLFTLDSVEVAKLNQDPRFSGILPRRFQNYSKIYLCVKRDVKRLYFYTSLMNSVREGFIGM